MFITKDGATMELDNDNHIAAFLSSGWVEAKAPAPAATEEPKAEPAVDFINPPEVTETAEVEIAAPAPKRGRKKQER